jgi:hypothetical protein
MTPAASAKRFLLEGFSQLLFDLVQTVVQFQFELPGTLVATVRPGDGRADGVNGYTGQDRKYHIHDSMTDHIQTSSKSWFEFSFKQSNLE